MKSAKYEYRLKIIVSSFSDVFIEKILKRNIIKITQYKMKAESIVNRIEKSTSI